MDRNVHGVFTNLERSRLLPWLQKHKLFVRAGMGAELSSHHIMTGGNLGIDANLYDLFVHLYVQDVLSGCFWSLSERACPVFPFFLDIDFPESGAIAFDIVASPIVDALGYIYENVRLYICLNESSGNLHMYTDINVTVLIAKQLHATILHALQEALPSTLWSKVIDENVCGRALRMLYAPKSQSVENIYRPHAQVCIQGGELQCTEWNCRTEDEMIDSLLKCRVFYPDGIEPRSILHAEYLCDPVSDTSSPTTETGLHNTRQCLNRRVMDIIQELLRSLCPEYGNVRVQSLAHLEHTTKSSSRRGDSEKMKDCVLKTLRRGSSRYTIPKDNEKYWSIILSSCVQHVSDLRIRLSTSDPGSRFCFIKNGYHKKQHIYFILSNGGGKCTQHCYDKNCATGTKREWIVPGSVKDALEIQNVWGSSDPVLDIVDTRWRNIRQGLDAVFAYASV
jgi:hypothetical protein